LLLRARPGLSYPSGSIVAIVRSAPITRFASLLRLALSATGGASAPEPWTFGGMKMFLVGEEISLLRARPGLSYPSGSIVAIVRSAPITRFASLLRLALSATGGASAPEPRTFGGMKKLQLGKRFRSCGSDQRAFRSPFGNLRRHDKTFGIIS
jgi:hypothetical protein